MDPAPAFGGLLRQPALAALVAAAVQEHSHRFGTDGRYAAFRRVLRDGLAIEADGEIWRSLWLLSQRGLRRGGFRQHPASAACILGWQGDGLVLVRPRGERRSAHLVPWDAPAAVEGERLVQVPAATPYDTLADVRAWHLLILHTQPAAGLVRAQQTEDRWVEIPEETPT